MSDSLPDPAPPGLGPRPSWQTSLLVLLFGILLYGTFCWSYGLWDPWETHYGEVARTMLQRGDFLTTYWQDEVFKSKPVLTFWLQALGMGALGLNADGAPAGEMALSSLPELGMRLPIAMVSVLCLFSIFLLVSRAVSRRAGILSAVVCATMPQYALISRQSITDMPFVATMSAGLCFFMLGLLVDRDEAPPGVTLKVRGRELTWTTWHLLQVSIALVVLPQMGLMIFDLGYLHARGIRLGDSIVNMGGLPYALPWLALLAFFVWTTWRGERRARHVYVHLGWMLCGLAVLGKGLGGIFIPVAVVGLFLVASRQWGLVSRLELLPGLALMLVTAAPWHHAMWIRHGKAFWSEYFGHHHFKRAQLGVHGDRGTFEYFVHQLGIGMFPWSGLVPVVVLRWIRGPEQNDRRQGLVTFSLIWAAVTFSLFALMETKFHHYALPVIPPVAILIGLWLDDVAEEPQQLMTTLGVVAAVGFTWLIARDLIRDPQHLVVMFIYKYDRAFPYELNFERWLWVLGPMCTLATAALLWARIRRYAVWGLAAAATLFTVWTIDHYLIRLSPHWGQKELHALYHTHRKGPQERLIAWQLNWRGENFYSKNQIVVHMQPKDTPKFKAFLKRYKGDRFWVVMDQTRLTSLKTILDQLGAKSKESLEIIGAGGQTWPDNYGPHFREHRRKVLYRERASLSETCGRYKKQLSKLKIPGKAGRYRGTGMEDSWWAGNCRAFVRAQRETINRNCSGPKAKSTPAECAAKVKAHHNNAKLCRDALRALGGHYPYPRCFETYLNNKFMIVRFTS